MKLVKKTFSQDNIQNIINEIEERAFCEGYEAAVLMEQSREKMFASVRQLKKSLKKVAKYAEENINSTPAKVYKDFGYNSKSEITNPAQLRSRVLGKFGFSEKGVNKFLKDPKVLPNLKNLKGVNSKNRLYQDLGDVVTNQF